MQPIDRYAEVLPDFNVLLTESNFYFPVMFRYCVDDHFKHCQAVLLGVSELGSIAYQSGVYLQKRRFGKTGADM
jgi:hypothetical protein